MDKQTKKYLFIIVGILLIIGVFLAWFFSDIYQWNETFRDDDDNPYGTEVLAKVIKKSVGKSSFYRVDEAPLDTLTKIKIDTLKENSNYVFIGNHMYVDEQETNFLLDFARQGNNLFLISKSFNQNFLDSLFLHPNVLLHHLIEQSYTALDDRNIKRIPCGFYDQDYIWHPTGYDHPNGYLDEQGDWRELKSKDPDDQQDYLDTIEDINEENNVDDLEIQDEEEVIIDPDNYDENGFWKDRQETEDDYDVEADTIGYYGKDGYWIRQDSASNSNYIPDFNPYFYDEDPGFYIDKASDSLAWIDFYDDEVFSKPIETTKIFDQKPIQYSWHFFTSRILDDTIAQPTLLGKYKGIFNDDTYTNYLVINYGEGKIFLHSTPLLFTNYMMVKEPYFYYAKEVFSNFGDGDVIWDESIRYRDPIEYENEWDNPKYHPDKGPLTFILSEPALKWAWYTILISLVLYMFFGLRRNQRIIPVTIPNKNTSKEYAETIAQLYMSKGKHNDIYRLKMDLFKSFIRNRYGINAQVEKDKQPALIESIIVKSEINKQHVEDIFKTYDSTFFRETITTNELVYFHDLLEEFYKNCK